MTRFPLSAGEKLNSHWSVVVADEIGQDVKDLMALTKRSSGSVIREAIENLVYARRAEIRKYREQRATVMELPETEYEDRMRRAE